MQFYAHSGQLADCSDWQLLADHLEATARLAAGRGSSIGLESAALMAGLFHDFGKYDPEFLRVLRGENIRVDHSKAGAELLFRRVPPGLRPAAEMLAYAILGHHAGFTRPARSR